MKSSLCSVVVASILLFGSSLAKAATITVTSSADSGRGTLRQAILDANDNPGADIVNFNIPTTNDDPVTIPITSELPTITDQLTIDGYTQSGAKTNTNATGALNTVLKVIIDGSDLPDKPGLSIAYTDNCVISGLNIRGFDLPVFIWGNSAGNAITGNFIGTDEAGTRDATNSFANILIDATYFGTINQARRVPTAITTTTIGGISAASRNLISGSGGDGIYVLGASAITVQGNLIGTDAAGTAALGNAGNGIYFDQTTGSQIGGATGRGNVISGNGANGIRLVTSSSSNFIQGNYIGTTVSGNAALGNVGAGVELPSGGNTVGGSTAALGNVISANSAGINISSASNFVLSNIIGLGANGTTALGNTRSEGGVFISGSTATGNNIGLAGQGNVISSNTGAGISVQNGGGNTNIRGNVIGLTQNGSAARPNTDGIDLAGAITCTVGGTNTGDGNTISGNTFNGVNVRASSSNVRIYSNRLGTNLLGTAAVENNVGVLLTDVSGVLVGGSGAGMRNIISGNRHGIFIQGDLTTSNVISGNYIGTNTAGTGAVPNTNRGITLDIGANNNIIGGSTPTAGNLISGNSGIGIGIEGSGTDSNAIFGNRIGTDTNGANQLANEIYGIAILNGAQNNSIGAGTSITGSAPGNVIGGNNSGEIFIGGTSTSNNSITGNLIGTNAAGTRALKPNRATGNGVQIIAAGARNTVGGTVANNRNVISGNDTGVLVNATTLVTVQGNYIGTDINGTAAVPNRVGVIFLNKADQGIVGGLASTPGQNGGNVISGNDEYGVHFGGNTTGSDANDSSIMGNIIGLNKDGTAKLPNNFAGVAITDDSSDIIVGGTLATTRNVISGNNGSGVYIGGFSSARNLVEGNYIGTNLAGTAALGNTASGVMSDARGAGNVVGGTSAATRNIVSGNGGAGIVVSFTTVAHTIQNNYVGTDVNGNAALANGNAGLVLSDAQNCVVGGSGVGNVFSGNSSSGIRIQTSGEGVDAVSNTIQGNLIGVGANGSTSLGNVGDGINVEGDNNVIGGLATNLQNVIKNNGANGIVVVGGEGNALRANQIANNGLLGINLQDTTETAVGLPTPNDALDADTGPNNLTNFPVITRLTQVGSTATIDVALQAKPNTGYTFDVYTNSSPDPTGFGEGETFQVATGQLTSTSTGSLTTTITIPRDFSGQYVSIVATDAAGNSSEFSQSVQAGGGTGTTNFVVNTNADTDDGACTTAAGGCTLREAINAANTRAGADVIEFNLTEPNLTITPTTVLPVITQAVTIDGYSQPGSKANTLAVGADAVLKVIVRGRSGVDQGLVSNAPNTIIRGLVLNNFAGSAVIFTDNTVRNSQITGCYIGTNAAGTAASGSPSSFAVIVQDGASNNSIGGTAPAERNIISGHACAIGLFQGPANTTIVNNYIGVNAAGTGKIGNTGPGILLAASAANTLIGGTSAAARNVIAGNETGISIDNAGTDNNRVQGNYIGLNADGTQVLGHTKVGIEITSGAQKNTVGGIAAGAANTIVGGPIGINFTGNNTSNTTQNTAAGNFIGTDAAGNTVLNGVELGNAIGVKFEEGAKGNLLGGTAVAARNIVAGNHFGGVVLDGAGTSANIVAGNHIGLSPSGTAQGNGDFARGISIVNGANANIIGGTTANSRNVISGQTDGTGIVISGSGCDNNVVSANYIGVNPAGTAGLSNSRGVSIDSGAKNNIIGGLTAGERNIISDCEFGVGISGAGTSGNQVRGNYLGTNAAGNAAIPNRFGIGIVDSASGNVIGGSASGARNLISGNVDGNIYVNGGNNNSIAGNYIGTNLSASAALGSFTTSASIIITGGSTGNTVGGSTAAERNIISGAAGHGIELEGSETGTGPFTNGNTVAGNYIGTDVTGTIAVPNRSSGILIVDGARNNLIGGTSAAASNLISGNTGPGVLLGGANSTGNVISANFIGTDVTGTKSLENVDGIQISGASQTTIGGLTAGERNVISGNGRTTDGRGIQIIGSTSRNNTITGNYIGTTAAGTAALGNGDEGVYINDAPNNIVGGSAVAARNLISGNGLFSIGSAGVAIIGANANGNQVQGNYIGTNAAGTAALANRREGVYVNGSTNTVSGNLISGNALEGIRVSTMLGDNTANNGVRGNRIGTNAAGTAALANGFGIRVDGNAVRTIIGGSTVADRNLISGNSGSGVILDAPNAVVLGNYIGVDAAGTKALPNRDNGLELQAGAVNGTIGGLASPVGSGQGNVISGNTGNGISVESDSSTGNRFQGNIIGADVNGTAILGNGIHGVAVSGGADNVIGGAGGGAGNLIAFNGRDGIEISGLALRTRARGNRFLANTGLPVNLRPSGEGNSVSTPNDNLDPDSGPNNLQNFPVITRAVVSGSSINIRGTLNSTPSGTYNVDLYRITGTTDEVRTFLATTQIRSDAGGNAVFNFSVGGVVGARFAAMVTNLKGNSGEFGAVFTATEGTVIPLTLMMDSPVQEGSRTAYRGTISRPAGSTGVVNVALTAVPSGELNLATVRIPGTATSADFDFFVIDNTSSQSNRTVTVTARAAGYTDGTATVDILDDDPTGGEVFAWGYGEYGQIGNGSTADRAIPVAVLSDAITVNANGSHSLAVAADGSVRAWGYNGAGQLGDGTQSNRNRPITVSGLSNVVDVAAGWYHSLALKNDGTVWAWGYNSEGQIGDNTTTRRLRPVRVQGLPKRIKAIAAGVYFSLALDVDGEVWAWGSNAYGQLGDGTKTARKLPVKVQIPAVVTAIAAGGGHSLFLKGNGSVWSCGWNSYGQLGQGSTAETLSPVRIAELAGCTSIAAGYAHSLALDGAGNVHGWGDNSYGQIGGRVTGRTSVPVQIKALTGIGTVLAGSDFSLFVQGGGSLISLGNNNHKQLGNNSTVAKGSIPASIFALQKVAKASAAYGHGLAIAEAAIGGALKPVPPSVKRF